MKHTLIPFALVSILTCTADRSASFPDQAAARRASPARPLVETYQRAMVQAPPPALGVDPFYTKHVDAIGIPIVSSDKVPDAALLMARDIVNFMLAKRPDVRAAMVERGARVAIMAQEEMQTDLPEYRSMKKPAKEDPRLTPRERENYDKPGGIGNMTDRQYWNARARGMGGNITSCAEENLLGYPGTRYFGEHILVHEFSHNIMSVLRRIEPSRTRDSARLDRAQTMRASHVTDLSDVRSQSRIQQAA